MKLSQLNMKKINLEDIDSRYSGQDILLKLGELYQFESGIYGYGNLWVKLERTVENIIIEELDKRGCIQVEFPKLQPKKIWEQSNRWDMYTKEGYIMFTLKNNLGEYGLAPTAEECATLFGANRLPSYKNLPAIYYQIGEKFRKEIRARGYLFRPRTFVMMDAYSFDKSEEDMKKTYQLMHEAYMAIFARLGLKIMPTVSDNGVIGRVYETETNVIENYMTDPLDGSPYIYTSNQTPNIFYTIDYSINITDNNYYIIKHTLTMLPNSQPYLVSDNGNLFKRDSISFNRQNCGTYITQDDRFLVVNVSPGSSSSYIGALIKINGETHAADSFYSLNSQYNANVILNNYNILIRISATKMEMYNISYNENNEISTLNLIKEININLSGGNNRVYDFNVLTLDNSRIVIITALKQGSSSEKNFNLTIFDVDTILNTINGETITPIQEIPFIQTNEPIGMYSDISGANIKVPTSENRLKGFYTAVDAGNLIGVIYQGKTFLKVTPEVLSAVSGDVKNGKTFIGSSGAVEIGTLEVNG